MKIKTFITAIIFISIISLYALASYTESHYTRTGTIKYIKPFTYELTDNTGHRFDFYANDIIKDGTTITAVLDTKGTTGYIYDDKIIDFKIDFDLQN